METYYLSIPHNLIYTVIGILIILLLTYLLRKKNPKK